jgi:dephospho-CoA kinase
MIPEEPSWTRRASDRIGGGRHPVLMVGLTGGIGTGKSTVDGMLREMGAPVLDADGLVREMLGPGGAAVSPVLAHFGPEVADDAGGIDRQTLGRLVFHDEPARRQLESIVHPLVLGESEQRLTEMAGGRGVELVVYDAALLVETGRYRRFDRLVVVTCHLEVRLQRLMDRDNLTADEAGIRLRTQIPIEKKVALADYVIDNSGLWHETRKQVEQVYRALRQDALTLRQALGREGERSRALRDDPPDERKP